MRYNTESRTSRIAAGIILSFCLIVFGLLAAGCSDSNANTDSSNQSGNNDWTTMVAATVDDHDIMESEVNDYISGYRKAYGYVSDSAWATFLDEQSATTSQYRESAIKQLAERYVVSQIADSVNISVSDDEVDAAIEEAKTESGHADDWTDFLSSIDMTEDSYREQIKSTLLVRKYAEATETLQTPSDSQMRSYAASNTGKYTGKQVYEASFSTLSEAQAVSNSIAGTTMSLDNMEKLADEHDGNVSCLGWSGLVSLPSECSDAIENIGAGQSSSVVHSGSEYVIYYVAQEFEADSNTGLINVADMPEELYNKLKSDTAASINANAMQDALDSLLEEHELKINEMPDGLPYDVDIKENSTYSTNSSNTGNTNSADNSSASTDISDNTNNNNDE